MQSNIKVFFIDRPQKLRHRGHYQVHPSDPFKTVTDLSIYIEYSWIQPHMLILAKY